MRFRKRKVRRSADQTAELRARLAHETASYRTQLAADLTIVGALVELGDRASAVSALEGHREILRRAAANLEIAVATACADNESPGPPPSRFQAVPRRRLLAAAAASLAAAALALALVTAPEFFLPDPAMAPVSTSQHSTSGDSRVPHTQPSLRDQRAPGSHLTAPEAAGRLSGRAATGRQHRPRTLLERDRLVLMELDVSVAEATLMLSELAEVLATLDVSETPHDDAYVEPEPTEAAADDVSGETQEPDSCPTGEDLSGPPRLHC